MRTKSKPSFSRAASIALALIAATGLCLATAYAIGLNITSPYFTLTFGGHEQAVDLLPTAASLLPSPTPQSAPTDLAPTQPVAAPDSGCLLDLVCVEAEAAADDETGVHIDVDDEGIDADLQPVSEDSAGQDFSIDLLGVQIGLGSGGLDLNFP